MFTRINLILLLLAISFLGGNSLQELPDESDTNNRMDELADVAIDMVLAGLGDVQQGLRNLTRPLLKITNAIGGEAKGFMKRLEENPQIKEAMRDVSSDENLGPVIDLIKKLRMKVREHVARMKDTSRNDAT